MLAYPVFSDATAEYPVVRKLLTGQHPPVGEVSHAVWVVAGYGLSFLPAAPTTLSEATFADLPEGYTADDAHQELEEHFASGAESVASVSWRLIVPILLSALKDYLAKR